MKKLSFPGAYTFGIPSLCCPMNTPAVLWAHKRSKGSEKHVTDSPCNSSLFKSTRWLLSLTLYAKNHNVVPADGTVINHNIPGPEGYCIPLFHFKALLARAAVGAARGIHIHRCRHFGNTPGDLCYTSFTYIPTNVDRSRKLNDTQICILNIERLKAFLGLKEWKSSCTEKEMQFFMRVLGTDTGKTYSEVDRNHCFFWGDTATEKCQNNTLRNYHFCTNDAPGPLCCTHLLLGIHNF